jgi:uracil-DNA glycosylase
MQSNNKFVNVALALNGVHSTFKKILLCDDIRPRFINAMTNINPGDMSPATEDIFHFAKYCGIDDIKVVLIGQHPDVDSKYEQGICFSSLNNKVSASLRNIYACLEKSKLIKSADDMNTSDLRSWARQGVLMLNLTLTTSNRNSSKHASLWEPITTHIIKTIGAIDRTIVFMLWGESAKRMKSIIVSKKAVILEETHPNPMYQNRLPDVDRFVNCDHFSIANKVLKGAGYNSICWDPNNVWEHIVFTDGSGLNTGNCNSKGSYATLFVSGPSKGTMMYGRIPPVMLMDLDDLKGDAEWNPEMNPCWIDDDRAYTIKSMHSITKKWSDPLAVTYIESAENETIFPNSQRGEGVAILMAFEHVICNGMRCNIEIVTDSMFWINMINDYIPRWVKLNRPFYVQKNPDVVSRMWKAMTIMNSSGIHYSLRHVKSHGKDPNADPFDVAMNAIVDIKALDARNSDKFGDFVCVYNLE